jgi:hypothetical protein
MRYEQEYGLVMPFVACQSNDGPYDDEAYVAGYEMGLLDQSLATMAQPFTAWRQMIHSPNRRQADLIAMRHDFVMTVRETDFDEWLDVEFSRTEVP